ncbi:MAG TPA: ATP-binding protein [Candidatus Paceibacterota bacterium]|nr:ATP-binding protein [Candidatus Paceibacterota bacterium]
MNFFERASIKRKQVLIILLTSATTLLLACTAFFIYDISTFRGKMVERATSVAEMIGKNCAAAMDFNDARSAGETLSALRGEQNIVAAAVFKADGREFASYFRNPEMPVTISPPVGLKPEHSFSRDMLVLSRPIVQQQETIGTIVLSYDLNELSDRLIRYFMIVSMVFMASLFVAFILSSRLQRVISDPIRSLARAARAVALEKDYSVRVEKHSSDELGQLIDGFNEMLSQIQQRDAALQSARDHLEHRVKERTEELANSFSLLNATLESTADGILVVDRAGCVTHFNAKFLQMWGIPRELMESGDAGRFLSLAKELMKDGDAWIARARELSRDPEMQGTDLIEMRDDRVFEHYTQPQRIDNQYVGRVWCFRDVTERKRSEEALQERLALKERIVKLAATVPGVIHTFKRRNDGAISMPYASPRVQEIYGLTPGELWTDASRIMELIHPDDVPLVRRSIDESARTMTPWRAEFRVRHPNNGEIWVENHSMPEADGDGLLWHGFLSNITERKMLEAKMSAMNKTLIETSRQAGMAEVATGVLHNVGNVLNSVNISATLVADGLRKSKAASLSRVVQLLEEHAADLGAFMSGDRGKQLPLYLRQLSAQLMQEQQKGIAELELLHKNIEHIKDIVAMQQNYARVSGVTETVRVRDLVEDALQMNSGSLNRHDVQVVRDYLEVPAVTLEKHKVLQILVNLIRNAKYACDDSGRSDKQITVKISPVENGVQIAVIDNGIGIPPENMKRIFNHGFTTRKHGHGFGLHSGALVAKEMGGVLKVHSDGLGTGASFIVELPINPPKGV